MGLSFAALTAIVYGLGAWMPSFLTGAGFTLDQALGASFALNACSIAGALAAGWLARAQGSRRVMLASAVATAILLIVFGLALEQLAGSPGLPARVALDALAGAIGATASIGVTTLYAMAALLYPAEIRSSGIGLGMTAGRIGGIGMSFAGGYLLDFAGGSALILFGVLAACALAATSAGWLVRRHISRDRR